MNRTSLKRGRRGLAVLAALGVAVTATVAGDNVTPASAVTPGSVGIVCANNGTNGSNFTMTTSKGYINLPDGNTAFMYGYTMAGHSFQHPGPVLCVNEGDTVTITLQNTLDEDVSMMFPGQENVLANGVQAQPQFNGSGQLTSLTNVATAADALGVGGGTVTYSFVAGKPGTFIYESGTSPERQVRVGLFGALIVRPSMGAAFGYNRADSQFTPTEEFLILLSEIDPYLNQAVETHKTFNMNNYHPRYWLVNGRGFPDSIADNGAAWLPNQPYGALARIHPYDVTTHPYPGMARYINVGTEDYPFHPHGNNGLVIGRDGNPSRVPQERTCRTRSSRSTSAPARPGT